MSPLYVIAVITNPIRFNSRYKLFKEFAERIRHSKHAVLYVVEMAFGQRPWEVTHPNNPHHIQVRGSTELWQKENLVNIGLQHLPKDWEYVAWIDADVAFNRNDWAEETVHQLQHYKIVQMFNKAIDLSPTFEPILTHTSFGYAYVNGLDIKRHSPTEDSGGYAGGKKSALVPTPKPNSQAGSNHHPGYAWAARREVLDRIGGLPEYALLGSGDWHMACSFIGQTPLSFHPGMTEPYTNKLLRFQSLCELVARREIGYVDQSLFHYWHGKKKDRGYEDRWKILQRNQYNPDLDIVRDTRGVIHLAPDCKHDLRDGLKRYFRSRNEDSLDL